MDHSDAVINSLGVLVAIGFMDDELGEDVAGDGPNKAGIPRDADTENNDLVELQDLVKGDNLIQV